MLLLWVHRAIFGFTILHVTGCMPPGYNAHSLVVQGLTSNLSRIRQTNLFEPPTLPTWGYVNSYQAAPMPVSSWYYPPPTPQRRPLSTKVATWQAPPAAPNPRVTSRPVRSHGTPLAPAQLLAEVGVRSSMVSPASLKRKSHPAMNPRYITIHSTGDYSKGASDYGRLMKSGLRSLRRPGTSHAGMLSWHFSVDSSYAIQHLSTFVQGGHADFNGLGNATSVGIEMCEYSGVNLNTVMERTARLTAYLMWKHKIPLSHVVPHYHWPRPGASPVRKACPHFLMDNGRPGAKWQAFLGRVQRQYQRLHSASQLASR